MKKIITLILLIFTISINSQIPTEQVYDGSNLSQVTSINSLPNGDMLITEKQGKLYKLSNDNLELLYDITDKVSNAGEQGLLNLVIRPNNPNEWFITYCMKSSVYTPGQPNGTASVTRTSKLTFNNNIFNETTVIDVPLLNSNHQGSSTEFDDTGMLLISTGDGASGGYIDEAEQLGIIPVGVYASNRYRSLQIETLVGKTLRIDPDTGLGLPNNPYWTGNGNDTESKIWTVGHRNPAFGCYYNGAFWLGNTLGFLPQSIERVNRGGVGFGYPLREGFEDTFGGADINYPGTTTPFSEFYLGASDNWDVSLDPDIGRWQAKLPILSYDRVNNGTELKLKDYNEPNPYYTISNIPYDGLYGGGMGFIINNVYGNEYEDVLLISDFYRNDVLAIKLDPFNQEKVINVEIIPTGQFQLTDITTNLLTDEIYMSFYGGEIRKFVKSTLSNVNYSYKKDDIIYYNKTKWLEIPGPSNIYDISGRKISHLESSKELFLTSGIYFVKYKNIVKQIVL